MKDFVILTDSCSDLDKEQREKYGIKEYVKPCFTIDGKEYAADLDGIGLGLKEFYDIVRSGKKIYTAQANVAQYTEVFEKYILEGYDILSISCSSALSASVKSSYVARDALLKKYPDAKIICIDTLRASSGLGLLCARASELKAEGKSIDEIAEWIEEHKLNVHQMGVVDSLVYLRRAGRVSAAKAFFGGLLNIKPVIIAGANGANIATEKVKGRAASLLHVAKRVAEEYVSVPYGKIFISHADCYEDAITLKNAILELIPDKDIEFHISYVTPVIGASTGPGMIGAYYYGEKVTVTE